MMKIYRDTADNNDDFIQIETAHENANEDVAFEKRLRWFETQNECNSMQLLMSTKFCDSTAKNISKTYESILICILINEISYRKSDCSIIRKFHSSVEDAFLKPSSVFKNN